MQLMLSKNTQISVICRDAPDTGPDTALLYSYSYSLKLSWVTYVQRGNEIVDTLGNAASMTGV